MIENISPWISQLKRIRPVVTASGSHETDVVVIGGGIAGICTAYFILCTTHKNVTIVEADKLAHGATGHNGGQVVSYFEKPFTDMVTEFGLEKAAEAQKDIHAAWELLDIIYDNANLQTPLHRFTGYAGCLTEGQVLQHLENKYLRQLGGLNIDHIMIAEDAPWVKSIPKRYEGLYSTLAHKNILSFLETSNTNYCGLLSIEKGVMNSALFTEELAGFLLKQFPKRMQIFEESPVTTIILDKDAVKLKLNSGTITAETAVLCTNGYKSFTIESKNGFDINRKFQQEIVGVVGYMAGYTEPLDKAPTAISYYTASEYHQDIYYYLTRRPYEQDKTHKHNLTCIGGPELVLNHTDTYKKENHVFEEHTLKEIDAFLRATYQPYPKDPVSYSFHWHGLMGYTKREVRLIGKEPCHSRLMYNLGCNGVGLLPSIYGGNRIARLISGEKLKPSIFDPVDTRCMIK